MTASRRALGAGSALALLAAALLAAPAAPGETVATSAASSVIAQTVDDVLAILNDGSLTHTARRGRIEQIAYARFDFDTTSRLVLARNWKRFSKPQQEAFVSEFKSYLARNYGNRIDRYQQEKVAIVGEREEPRGDVTVLTKIVGGEFDAATVDYRLRERGGEWRVIDVKIEGISLVSNYRDQFKSVISRDGPDGLLEQLRGKNASGVIDETVGN